MSLALPKPQFISNENGEKNFVVLSYHDYKQLLEDIEDLAIVAERIYEPSITHEQFIQELKNDGYL